MSFDDFQREPDVAQIRADEDPGALPPVQPPSAGLIVQLFVVPALIVLAVVAVWALFGRIAASDEDWRELVEDIRNTNEHRRWRGANGLATLLVHDQQLGEDGQHLAKNPEIARVLVGLFEEGLNRRSQREDDLKQEAFLARTLGLLDSPDTVLPQLERGMKPDQDREIRKNSIASIAVISLRIDERQQPFKWPSVVEELVSATSDPDPLIRDTSTYALGLVETSASHHRLAVLVGAGDFNTRVNAAVGLARQKSTEGFVVFKEVLSESARTSADPEASQKVESLLAAKNVLHAIRVLAGKWSPAERDQLVALIEPVSRNHPEPRIRTDAIDTLVTLRKN